MHDDRTNLAPTNPVRTPVAPDLSGEETELAAWFSHLTRVDAPEGLRARVLAADRPKPAGTLLRFPMGAWGRFPMGAWGVASAAVLVLALGAAVAVELFSPMPEPRMHPQDAARAAVDLKISEDETLALYHGVELFDEVGMAPGELIADWGR